MLLGNGINANYAGVDETPLKTTTPLDTAFGNSGTARYVEIVVDDGDDTFTTTDVPIAPRQQITSTAYSFRTASALSAETIAAGTDLKLNGSTDYGLGWYGLGRMFASTAVDGPVLYGQAGGALGSVNGAVKKIALRWNAAGAAGVGSADLNGAAATTKLVLQGDDANAAPMQLNIRCNSDTNKRLLLGYNNTSSYGSLQAYSTAGATTNLYLNPMGGNVGIGTTTATFRLDVNGSLRANAITGTSFTGTSFTGSGANLTALNANNISSGTLADARLSSNVALLDRATQEFTGTNHTFNGVVGIGRSTMDLPTEFSSTGLIVQNDDNNAAPKQLVIRGDTDNNKSLRFGYNTTNDYGSIQAYGTSSSVTGLMLNPGGGSVGIGTSDPEVPLHVVGNKIYKQVRRYFNVTSTGLSLTGSEFFASVSIKSSNGVEAAAFYAVSDERIKENVRRADMSEDLATILKLRVVDYRMKDRVAEGDAMHKGFIAQEVRALIPEAVNTGRSIVPSIYSIAEEYAYDPASHTLRVSLAAAHELAPGARIRLITEQGEADYDVTAVPDKNTFLVGSVAVEPKQVFVYGKQVDDFLSVDYDRIFSTGISALQQLKKEKDSEINALRDENTNLRKRLAALEGRDKTRDEKIAAIEKLLGSPDRPVLRTISLKAD